MICWENFYWKVKCGCFFIWDNVDKVLFGEREWYFFLLRDRKYFNGVRFNRVVVSGYWKVMGIDKFIFMINSYSKVGVKKVLVFYCGKVLKGEKINWIMYEYCFVEGVLFFVCYYCCGLLRVCMIFWFLIVYFEWFCVLC